MGCVRQPCVIIYLQRTIGICLSMSKSAFFRFAFKSRASFRKFSRRVEGNHDMPK